jgi:hypothetical protein
VRHEVSIIPNALGKEELWNALVQTAHALLMYKNHKRYVEEILLKERPDISPQELAVRLSIPLGEALVLLSELRSEAGRPKGVKETSSKTDDRSLLDYTK